MNDTRIASKAKAQLASFMGKVFTHFSKPETRFVEDCIYGIQASGDAMLSSIVRATDDDIRPIYTEKRLSRNLDSDGIGDSVAAAVLKAGAASVRSDTLLLVDPTEIRKEFAHAMEYLTRVRDASRSSKEGRDVIVNGYHGCMVAACRIGGRRTVPLALRLWSSRAPGFKGENDEVLKIIKAVYAATGGKGVMVYDRGGDRPAFYDYLIGESRDFVIRLTGRNVLAWRGMHETRDLAMQCTMRHSHHVTFDSHGRECNVSISFGAMPVRLPMHPKKELHMVVVKGFGREPMMLLTSLPVDGSFTSQWRIVDAYLSRWRVEETIRFVKQAYGLENIRVMSYTRIRNMASLVLAAAYFSTVWIGRHVRHEVLAEHLTRLGERLGEVPQFAAYAIADGLKRAFTRFGKWVRTAAETVTAKPEPTLCPLLPGFADLLDLDDG